MEGGEEICRTLKVDENVIAFCRPACWRPHADNNHLLGHPLDDRRAQLLSIKGMHRARIRDQ